MYQLKIFSFLNRLLKDNMEKYIETVVECYRILMDIVSETVLISEI
jgi:GH35 family endo-1,4-beta-xylanase